MLVKTNNQNSIVYRVSHDYQSEPTSHLMSLSIMDDDLLAEKQWNCWQVKISMKRVAIVS